MDYEEADKNALVKAQREEIVGWHLDNEHQSVCLADASGYDTGDWRPLPRHEADEFGDECIICHKPIVPQEERQPIKMCTTRVPEPHEAGEFPMTCYACHIVADS